MRVWMIGALALLGCSSSSSASPDGGGPVRGALDPKPFGGSRPVQLYVPSGYKDASPAPLLLVLHGYSVTGATEEFYLNFTATADARGFLYAYPTGTTDSNGNAFWNATDACCNYDGSNVDDVAYLTGLVTEIGTRYKVDPKRVYLFGHSNGGFMAYRLACDEADVFAAIASLAGAMWLDAKKCHPSAPVAVLQVHGTADKEVLYAGTSMYPSAMTSVTDWATLDGCAQTADTSMPPVDIESALPGPETTITRYASGCKPGSEATLWTIQGGAHIPGFTPDFARLVFDFFTAHPKP